VSLGAFLGALRLLWRWGWGVLWLGRRAERSPRRVDGLTVRLGFVGEWESLVRCGGRVGWRLCLGL
jgi:hypothetical protein